MPGVVTKSNRNSFKLFDRKLNYILPVLIDLHFVRPRIIR